MSRPKGSKNKPKEIEQPITVETPFGPKTLPPEPGTVVTWKTPINPEKWTPTPDMGDVKEPPREEKKCSQCSHIGVLHYGGIASWCNRTGCNCQGFK